MKKMNFEQMEIINGGRDCLSEGLYLTAAGIGFAAGIVSGGWALVPLSLVMLAAQKAFHDCVTEPHSLSVSYELSFY
jgi:hypothetical protein